VEEHSEDNGDEDEQKFWWVVRDRESKFPYARKKQQQNPSLSQIPMG